MGGGRAGGAGEGRDAPITLPFTARGVGVGGAGLSYEDTRHDVQVYIAAIRDTHRALYGRDLPHTQAIFYIAPKTVASPPTSIQENK